MYKITCTVVHYIILHNLVQPDDDLIKSRNT